MGAMSSGANRWRPDLVPAALTEILTPLPDEAGISGAEWLERLPHVLGDLLADWQLTDTGVAWSGQTSVVVPVVREGDELALKVVWPHPEAAAEHLALQHWGGRSAVRLMSADPRRGALLLERLDPSRDLTDEWIDSACEIIGALLSGLHRPAGPDIPSLVEYLDPHIERLTTLDGALPRRAIERATALYRELRPTAEHEPRLLHTDLHFGNVLWREADQQWVVIDPKPMAGHPGFELHPILRNRVDEHGTGAAFRWSVRHRLELVCEAAGLDEELARWWTIVAATLHASWATRAPTSKDTITFNLMLLKALED